MNRLLDRLLNSTVWSPADTGGAADPGKKPDGAPPGDATKLPGKDSDGKPNGEGGDVWKGLTFKDPDNLEYVKTKGWQDPEETVKSYRELESNGSKDQLKLPGKDAKPEELDDFYNKIGRPEKADGYEFKISDKVPENFPYEESTALAFKDVAHKARLTGAQAQELHDWYVENTAKAYTTEQGAAKVKIESAHDLIVKEYGDPTGEVYKRNIELADRAVRELSGKDKKALRQEMIDIGALTPDGKVMAPRLIMAFAKIGNDLYAEDKVYSGISSSRNPWKAETEDVTLQGKIIKEDPEMARQLILAANLDPVTFGLTKPVK